MLTSKMEAMWICTDSIFFIFDLFTRFSNGGLFNWEPSTQTWKKPESIVDCFKNVRWFKFFESAIEDEYKDILFQKLSEWVCKQYSERQHYRVYNMTIYKMSESYNANEPFAARVENPKELLHFHACVNSTRP
jgi:hypothetical protein